MKGSRPILFFFTVCSFCAFSLAAQTTKIGERTVLHIDRPGPVALALVWTCADTGLAIIENSLWLDAAIHGGTQRIGPADWEAISRDYLISWRTATIDNTTMLIARFAPSQSALALQMLQDLLHGATLDSLGVAQWRHENLYHYHYYQRDPDSLMKWWAMGTESRYKTLENTDFSAKKNGILGHLGLPQTVACAGPADSTLLAWMEQVRTAPVPEPWKRPMPSNMEIQRPKLGLMTFRATQVRASDPLSGLAAWHGATPQSSSGSWKAHDRYFGQMVWSRPTGPALETEKPENLSVSEAWVHWLLIRERNVDMAVAAALVNLGIWPEYLLLDNCPKTKLNPMIISQYIMR